MALSVAGKVGRGKSLEMRVMAFRLNYKKEYQELGIRKTIDLGGK